MRNFILPLFASLLTPAISLAGTQLAGPARGPASDAPFEKGGHEFQLGVGFDFTTHADGALKPSVQDLDFDVRLGWMLTSAHGTGFFRGNWEFLVDAFAGGVTDGPGGSLAGGAFFLRYNFVQPQSRWVPYFQVGLGALYDDVYRNQPQRLVGQAFEFTIQESLGLRYLFTEHTAAYVEAGYRHISNANLADRNYGLNSIAVQAGISVMW